MKKRISLIIVGCLLSTMLRADDADSRQKLVGTWIYATTKALSNDRTNTVTEEFQYHADGTFEMKGEYGLIAPTNARPITGYMIMNGARVMQQPMEYPYKRQFGGSGIWRIEQGCFYTTFTNNLGAWHVESGTHTYMLTNSDPRVAFMTPPMNMETKDEIISVTGQEFTTRDGSGQMQTATRKQ